MQSIIRLLLPLLLICQPNKVHLILSPDGYWL
jgi:hypothetical protein